MPNPVSEHIGLLVEHCNQMRGVTFLTFRALSTHVYFYQLKKFNKKQNENTKKGKTFF